jgi:hypothetical protein
MNKEKAEKILKQLNEKRVFRAAMKAKKLQFIVSK